MKFYASLCYLQLFYFNYFTKGNTLFTADVLQVKSNIERTLQQNIFLNLTTKKNTLFSPLSLEIILASLQAGSDDKTGREIRQTLHHPNTEEENESLIKSILQIVQINGSTVYLANSFFVDYRIPIKQSFKRTTVENYGVDIHSVDFSKTNQVVNNINNWVQHKLRNKLDDFVTPENLQFDNGLLLASTLHFKGNWITGFNRSLTRLAKFYVTPGNSVVVTSMRLERMKCNYYDNQELDARFLELPFQGYKVSLTIVLPNETNGLESLEKRLSEVVRSQPYSKQLVEIDLPKFKIEDKIDFNVFLRRLGMARAFNSAIADFSKIGGDKGDLIVSKILQKTSFEVNEEGGGISTALHDSSPEGPIINFNVDHPFIYFVTISDFVLLAGKFVNPLS